MDQPEFEIDIRPDGQVKVHIKGVKGGQCLSFADMLTEIIGKETSRELTQEYYEQDQVVRINTKQRRV